MSAAPQLNLQHPQPNSQPDRPALHLHQPDESQAKTRDDLHLAGMLVACGAFALALAGFVVVPYFAQWLAF